MEVFKMNTINETNVVSDVSENTKIITCKNEWDIKNYCSGLASKNEDYGEFIYKKKHYTVTLNKLFHIYNDNDSLFGCYHASWGDLELD